MALAQSSTGTITGQVADPQKSLIPGAQITLTNTGTNETHTAVTSAGGVYIFPSLTPGTYNVSATAKGFEKDVVNSVEVGTGVEVTVNFTLLVGAESTTVEVKATGEMLNQDSATMNSVVDKDTVVQLPYPERSALEVATLAPGVNGDPQYAGGVQSENPGVTTQPNTPGASIAIAGGRPGSASQLVDGFDVTLSGYPRAGITFSKDTIHDVTVQEGFLPAQYGRNGGGIINQSTASGTSLYHGKFFYRHYDPMLEARTQGIASAPDAHQNLFTAMLSGPVPIPSRHRSKMFFLAGYEPLRGSNKNWARRRISSPLELAGQFHDSLDLEACTGGSLKALGFAAIVALPHAAGCGIYNQFSGTPNPQGFPTGVQFSKSSQYLHFANDDISALVSQNPVAQFLAALQPVPTNPSPYVQYLFPTGSFSDDLGNIYLNAGNAYDNAGNNVQSVRAVTNSDNRYTIRVDDELDSQDSIFARFTVVPVSGLRYDYFGQNSIADQIPTDRITSRNIGIGETHIFGGAKVNELRVTYLRSSRYRGPAAQTLTQDFGALMGLTAAVAGKGFPTFNYGNNLSAIGSGGVETDGGRSLDINFGVGDDFSVLVGRHTFKFGVDYRALQLNRLDDSESYGGNYGFNQDDTSGPASGGSTLATFDLGIIGSYVARAPHPFYYRWKYGAFYAQDDWRIFPKLTLNLGVRYNVETPRMEKNGMQGSFVPNVQGTLNGQPVSGAFAFSGQEGLRNTLWPTNYKGVEPRIGFAYAPTVRTSVRASYSLMHTPLTGVSNSVLPDLPIPPPFSTTVGTSQGGINSSAWVNYITNPVGHINTALATPASGPLFQYAASAGSAGTGSSTSGAMPYVSQSYAVPYVQIWTLSLQYQLSANTVAEFSYVGQHGVHLYAPPVDKNVGPLTGPNSFVSGIQNHLNFSTTGSPNPYGLGTKGLETLTQALRPYQQFYNNTIWDVFDRDATSSYNAFYVRFLRRQSTNLTLMSAFSWSKSMDNASSGSIDGTVTDSYGFAYPQLPYNLEGEYSLSLFDQPLTFKAAYVYMFPFGTGHVIGTSKHWVDAIIGNWSTTGILHINSGVPMHVELGTPGYFLSTEAGTTTLGNYGAAIQDANIRPNLVPGQPIIKPHWKQDPFGYNGGGYLNPLAFSIPGSQDNPQLGSIPRTLGNARNPRTIEIDMSLRKVIPLRNPTHRLQFQADAINAVNHANYFLNTSLSAQRLYTGSTVSSANSAFGDLGGASAGRIVALGATYTF
jgi:hypothetical protein